MTRVTDEELVDRVLDGSEMAIRRLVDRHHGRLLNFLTGKVRQREEARDLTQDTWARVWRHLHRYDPDRASFSSWIHVIADRIAANAARTRSRRPLTFFSDLRPSQDGDPLPLQFEDGTYTPDRVTGKRQLRAAVDEAIEELPPRQRSVIRLRERRGMTYKEIAEQLGVKLGTVKSALQRARAAFRESMALKLDHLPGEFERAS